VFDRIDKDKSGELSREEFIAEIRRLCPMSKSKDVDELFTA